MTTVSSVPAKFQEKSINRLSVARPPAPQVPRSPHNPGPPAGYCAVQHPFPVFVLQCLNPATGLHPRSPIPRYMCSFLGQGRLAVLVRYIQAKPWPFHPNPLSHFYNNHAHDLFCAVSLEIGNALHPAVDTNFSPFNLAAQASSQRALLGQSKDGRVHAR